MADFTLLLLPGAYSSGVAATMDILQTAAGLAPRVKRARPVWRVASPAGGYVALTGGLGMDTARLPARSRADDSVWVIPGLGLPTPAAIEAGLSGEEACRAIAAVAAHAARGGQVAASCSAVFLLRAAGLLARRRVTTSWWLAAELQRLEPDCTVDADRMVCADGPVHTAGAAFAQSDLMLHLLRQRFGVHLADAVGRVLLIDGRQAQAPFVVPALLASGDALVARLIARIESALPRPPSVAALADAFAMSQRTLARHVQKATGRSTLDLIQSVRLHRARMLIESSRISIEEVAAQVGYEDATALRRLMRKVAGANPSRYRVAAY